MLIPALEEKLTDATPILLHCWTIMKNIVLKHQRLQEEKGKFDFVVSRAVMPLGDLVTLVKKNISKTPKNAIPNGLICLKGGELQQEMKPYKSVGELFEVSDFFKEEYFETKKAVYIPI